MSAAFNAKTGVWSEDMCRDLVQQTAALVPASEPALLAAARFADHCPADPARAGQELLDTLSAVLPCRTEPWMGRKDCGHD